MQHFTFGSLPLFYFPLDFVAKPSCGMTLKKNYHQKVKYITSASHGITITYGRLTSRSTTFTFDGCMILAVKDGIIGELGE